MYESNSVTSDTIKKIKYFHTDDKADIDVSHVYDPHKRIEINIKEGDIDAMDVVNTEQFSTAAEQFPTDAKQFPTDGEQFPTDVEQFPTSTDFTKKEVIRFVNEHNIPVIIKYDIQSSYGFDQPPVLNKCNIENESSSDNDLKIEINEQKMMSKLNKKSTMNVKSKFPKTQTISKTDSKKTTNRPVKMSDLKKQATELVHLACLILLDCIKKSSRDCKISDVENAEITILYLMTGNSVETLRNISWKNVLEYTKELEFEQRTFAVIKKYFSKYTMFKLLTTLRKIKRKSSSNNQIHTKNNKSTKNVQNKTDQGFYTEQFKPMFTTKDVNCNADILQYFSPKTIYAKRSV